MPTLRETEELKLISYCNYDIVSESKYMSSSHDDRYYSKLYINIIYTIIWYKVETYNSMHTYITFKFKFNLTSQFQYLGINHSNFGG